MNSDYPMKDKSKIPSLQADNRKGQKKLKFYAANSAQNLKH
jgi:hypothetical protein